MVAEEDSGDLRTPEGADILRRITALVNETIQSISGTPDERLSEEDVLELIDLGCSQVWSACGFRTVVHCISSP